MPKKYKYPKAVTAGAKRKFPRKKKKARKMNIVSVPNYNSGLPRNAYVTFRQKFAINVDTGSAPEGKVYIKGNSLYRPFGAVDTAVTTPLTNYATTDLPAYKGIYCGATGLYQNYRVYKSKLILRSVGEINGGAIRFAIAFNTFSSAYANYKYASESMHSKSTAIGTMYKPAFLSNQLSTSTAFGVDSRTIMTDDHYQAVYNLDPINQFQWAVWWQRVNGADIASTVPLEFELIMYAKLEAPQEDNA